ncbi:hypothetical protein N7481_008765 [Penicillium waksmanii]|uniref:uncharacterized protein n=1 Tax=Penicillium waksmanii TaxID=69791 RepID=UPI002546DB9C|nr:uncharacterized protein N7481_008765 [Penicillium waksmanii]KAJ5975058.1 hypothetical protein N7481_008765 [Penicillium waksmanii]
MSGSLALRDKFSEPSLTPLDNSQYRPLGRDGFEIAIICALPRETNAVLCAMDQIWHDCRHYYGKIAGDDNSYDFGRMGSHCVVIVTLPNMGPVAASSASRSLKMSFSSIQLALLVGICGAVPFKKDNSEILLGDVIISEAVVELDYGRQYHDSFRRKDSLLDVHGRPNEEILGLLQRWKIPMILETLRRGSIWHLRHLLQRLNIDYPGASHDMLFASEYIHKHHDHCLGCSGTADAVCQSALASSCSDILCDERQLVARHRLHEVVKSGNSIQDLEIHIGSIGTGNAVVRSARHRDQHALLEGIIAFEMEGVGVWDKFNCLVIKGVCDYADSHKSKTWQDYAAAVAAAVAKEVLQQYVRPQGLQQPTVPNGSPHLVHWELFSRSTEASFRHVYGSHHSRSKYLFEGSAIKDHGDFSERGPGDISAQQRVLASLRFPRMQDRAQQIESAHDQTYEWVLESQQKGVQRWDDLATWLSSNTETRNIYWISGKPGSGKSTLMRFLAERLNLQEHMLPWAQGCSVLRASYFSWSPGEILQKSLEGLLRSLLLQILKQKPDLIREVIDDTRWSTAKIPSIALADWNKLELISCLQNCISALQKLFIKVLLFVDGLDEFECTDEIRQELIETFRRLAFTGNVKVFLSSRPWNIFQDSLNGIPRIRLEDLTREDIRLYVRAKFLNNLRFHQLLSCDKKIAEALILAVGDKAEGVFLWVRLVVRDLLKGIRDGDGIQTLHRKLNEIPADLNEYFKTLFSSIDSQHMREASVMLQVALHEEDHFATLHPLRLLDLSFTDESSPDFAIADSFNYPKLSMNDREGLRFRLDSTIRRLNSRCMGLLECTYNPCSFFDISGHEFTTEELENASLYQDLKFEPSIYPEVFDCPNLLQVFMPTVDFLHRCSRDFLVSPHIEGLLHQQTGGEYDARMLIVNARISQFLALQKAGCGRSISLGLASYIMSALSIPKFIDAAPSIRAACMLQPAIEAFACQCGHETYSMGPGWYIGPSLRSWHEEKSNFLTLAIDFNLRGYCTEYLTANQVQRKNGRPILDYILRPRFTSEAFVNIGYSVPNVDLIHRVLIFGADPNGLYQGVSVWALFLSSTADWLNRGFNTSAINKSSYLASLRMMIDRGGSTISPVLLGYGSFAIGNEKNYRWPKDLPTVDQAITRFSQPSYAVADLLETFRIHFEPEMNDLIELARGRSGKY